jgi:micrococcal nuclease
VTYEYRATILRVVDGDTVHARVDLGFDLRIDMKLRLYGINAPELSTPDGPKAKQHLIELLNFPSGEPLSVSTIKDRQEKYGRYLAVLTRDDGTNINERMVADGAALVYLP